MKVLLVEAPHIARFHEVPTPVPKGNQILIKVKRAGICGTDNAIFTGDCSFVRDGLIRYPVRFGHEWSGVVEAVGDHVRGFKKGDRVIADNAVSCGECPACLEGRYADCQNIKSVGTVNCWDGCFAEYMLMPEYHVYHLEDSISYDQAALIEPISIAYESFKGKKLKQDSTVVVIGTGPVGMASVALAKYYGAGRIVMVGRRDHKLAIAAKIGATDVVNNTKANTVDAILQLTGGRGADLIIETSGAESSLIDAIRSATKYGWISVIGFYEEDIGNIPIDHLVLNCIQLQGAAGCYRNAEAVKKIMAETNLNLDSIITHRVQFENCLEFFENNEKYHDEKIKVMVEFD